MAKRAKQAQHANATAADGDGDASAPVQTPIARAAPKGGCYFELARVRVSSLARVTSDYKAGVTKGPGDPCGGPYEVAGVCGEGQMCALGVKGDDPQLLTGTCRGKCASFLEACAADRDCCGYWGKQQCSAQMGLCVPAGWNMTEMLSFDSKRR